MKWTSVVPLPRDGHDWWPWFAWFPVRISPTQKAWFSWVERRLVTEDDRELGHIWHWEYHP